MPERRLVIIEAPSTLGLLSEGVEALPSHLRDLGLHARIRARRSVQVPALAKKNVVDPDTHVLNARELAKWSPRLADAVGDVLDRGEFPVVLGGDCTIVLGSMLALRRRGRYGLLFVDGNADFFQPEAEPNGEGASMDLAFVTGHGPGLITNLEGLGPIVRPEDAVVLGYRDHDDQREYGSQPLPSQLLAFDFHRVRELGAARAAQMAVAQLARPERAGFFIHLDVDVLDDAVMPAVDFRMPGGLSADELHEVLKVALASEKAVGLEVAIYNPRLDTDGKAGQLLASVLASVLAPPARA